MITVKRYNPDTAMSISREHAWMRETPEGGHVEYGDYASLFAQFETVKAERDALEIRLRNALTSEQEAIQRAHAANQTADELAVENKGLKMKAAFIEARGVDKFADSQIAYVRKHRSELDPMTRAAYCGSATDARRFADELREAK